MQWLWLLEKSYRGHPDAPRLVDLCWHFDLESPFAQEPDVAQHLAVNGKLWFVWPSATGMSCHQNGRKLWKLSLRQSQKWLPTLLG